MLIVTPWNRKWQVQACEGARKETPSSRSPWQYQKFPHLRLWEYKRIGVKYSYPKFHWKVENRRAFLGEIGPCFLCRSSCCHTEDDGRRDYESSFQFRIYVKKIECVRSIFRSPTAFLAGKQ